MKESLDRSELRRMQREQERERRRIRDRQRRQSMTVEQRERHLARRRRNYQLRRLRAENAKVDCQSQQISNEHEAAGGNEVLRNDAQEVTQTEKLSAERLHYSECLEAAACKSANFTKRLRLSHIRRLARSLNHLGGEAIGNHQVVADVITKGDANNTCCFRIGDFDSGRLPNGLRLNRVKRLARTLNSAAHETSVNCQKVDQNVSAEEVPVTRDCKPKFGQTISVGGDVEGPNMDGNNQLQFPCT
ncbi:uncharacterized protein LOC110771653 isoform X2 [Prunus avium]|uniref:Uncharacterized protein LOC110771653 isoform X2 n=1 Tax=Prunus avium TaxID=42229 RepID=A0A6P5TV76_PRUAV|nr:uncharacterized protein LOC110771653 isoform X2 [Prunus avium]